MFCSEVNATTARHSICCGTVGAMRVASKPAGLNVEECLQPRKRNPMVKSLHGIDANRRPVHNVGKAKASWEETSMRTARGAGVGDQARREGIAEVNVGKDHLPAGAGSNLQRPPVEGAGDRGRDLVWRMSPYERRREGNAFRGGARRLPSRGNTSRRQRGSGHLVDPDRSWTLSQGSRILNDGSYLTCKLPGGGVYTSQRLSFVPGGKAVRR